MTTGPVQSLSMLPIDPNNIKIETCASSGPLRKRKAVTPPPMEDEDAEFYIDLKPLDRAPMSRAKEIRLDQNRKAARESRKRKKVMVEELQRSVIFFSRANAVLKQQNEELNRMLIQAQSLAQQQAVAHQQQPQVAPQQQTQPSAQQQSQPVMQQQSQSVTQQSQPAELQHPQPVVQLQLQPAQQHQSQDLQEQATQVRVNTLTPATAPQQSEVQGIQSQQNQTMVSTNDAVKQEEKESRRQSSGSQSLQPNGTEAEDQAHAQAVATQALFESQGFPPAAARAAAQTFVPSPAPSSSSAQTSPHPPINANATAVTAAANLQAAAANLQAAASAAASVAASTINPHINYPGMGYLGVPIQASAIALQQQAAVHGQQYNPHAFAGYHPAMSHHFQIPHGMPLPNSAFFGAQPQVQQQFAKRVDATVTI